ncbi:MAG: antitoxin VapB family protein [Candidatus ainarchaeum sp.]|nr:antitoxin VapB family protein [Candidatus ainarchaeum sp.]
MVEVTTIQLTKPVVEKLKKVKKYPRQSYSEVISELIDVINNTKRENQYDEFLHNVQKRKMKELWDNKEDEDWESA